MSSLLPHLLYLLLLCAHALPAQTTIYRNKYSQRVDSAAGYDNYDRITRLDSGVVRVHEYSVKNGLRRVGQWKNYDPDSLRNAIPVGQHRSFRSPDTLWTLLNYRDGKLAERRAFYPDGKLKRLEQYQGDSMVVGQCLRPDGTEMPFFDFERRPEFPGGERAMMQYLSENMKYPIKARRRGVQGSVVVTFVIEKNGDVSSVEAVRKIGTGCDEEAERVIREMPRWTPGYVDDYPVKVKYTLPLKFRLE